MGSQKNELGTMLKTAFGFPGMGYCDRNRENGDVPFVEVLMGVMDVLLEKIETHFGRGKGL